MCGRYTLRNNANQLALRFDVDQVSIEPEARYNIAPTQPVAVVTASPEGRTLDAFKWGLVPFWAEDQSIGNRMINARAETVTEKPAFKNAFRKRRCLVPCDGFYEWKKEGDGKQPYFIRRRDDAPFAFAGLWEEWDKDGTGPLRTCCHITVGPNDLMRPIHDRMPAILLPEDEAAWLAPDADITDLLPLLRPYPDALLEAYPVSRLVNSPGNEGAELIEPAVTGVR